MTRQLILGLALLSLALCLFAVQVVRETVHDLNDLARYGTTNVIYLEEDEPGWDCRTMGNRICGPTN